MGTNIKGKKIAILATDGFEQIELTEPKKSLEKAGAKVEILSIKEGMIKGWTRPTGAPASKSTASSAAPAPPSTTLSFSPAARSTPINSAPTSAPWPSSNTSPSPENP